MYRESQIKTISRIGSRIRIHTKILIRIWIRVKILGIRNTAQITSESSHLFHLKKNTTKVT